jgi:hypothetical protein
MYPVLLVESFNKQILRRVGTIIIRKPSKLHIMQAKINYPSVLVYHLDNI